MIRHLSGIAEIVEDVGAAAAFYRSLGCDVKHEPDDGYAVVQLDGVLHFGLWDRRSAAESTYGDASAIDRVPLGFTIGIEVDDVDLAVKSLDGNVLRGPADEPWGQRTVRFGSPSGALCELSATPGARELKTNVRATSPSEEKLP